MMPTKKSLNLSAVPKSLALAVVLTFLARGEVAQAQELCAQIDEVIDHAGSRFASILKEPTDRSGDHEVTLKLADAENCQVTRRSRQSWYQCAWDFPRRAPAASERFDGLVQAMTLCFGERARLYEDQSVNHPDSYSLRGFELPQAEVSVSIKDKGALEKTFVFLRVRGKAQE